MADYDFTIIDIDGLDAWDTAAYGSNDLGQIVGGYHPRGGQSDGFVASPK